MGRAISISGESMGKGKGGAKRVVVARGKADQGRSVQRLEDQVEFSRKDLFDPCWSWRFMRSCAQ